MFEKGEAYTITMIEMVEGEGLAATTYPNLAVAGIEWPMVRFRNVLGEVELINVASAHFVKAVPVPTLDISSSEPSAGTAIQTVGTGD